MSKSGGMPLETSTQWEARHNEHNAKIANRCLNGIFSESFFRNVHLKKIYDGSENSGSNVFRKGMIKSRFLTDNY